MSPLNEFFEASCKKIRVDSSLKTHVRETFVIIIIAVAAIAGVDLTLLCALYVARKLLLILALGIVVHNAKTEFKEKKRVVDELEAVKKGSSTHDSTPETSFGVLLG